MFYSLSHLTLSLTTLTILLLIIPITHSAFNTPIERNGDWVEKNNAGTWCYYPEALNPKHIDIACVGTKADVTTIIQAHLNTTTSINYFSSSNDRYGGADWPVDNTLGRIYICLSGRGGDGSYLTTCSITRGDNTFGGATACKIEAQQNVVTDGCYEPNLPKPPNSNNNPTGRPSAGRPGNVDNVGGTQSDKATHPGYIALVIASIIAVVF